MKNELKLLDLRYLTIGSHSSLLRCVSIPVKPNGFVFSLICYLFSNFVIVNQRTIKIKKISLMAPGNTEACPSKTTETTLRCIIRSLYISASGEYKNQVCFGKREL